MRYLFLLLITCMYSSVFAQQTSDLRISYEKKNASLDEIFQDLERQYGIRFSYATESIKDRMTSVDFADQAIEDVLDVLLTPAEMEFKIVQNNILLRKNSSYDEANSENYQSSVHIKGKIINKNTSGEAIDYATITISNTSLGTYSDQNGKFDLEIPNQYLSENLQIQYLGYEEEVYKVSEFKDKYLLVQLNESPISIDEIVIVNQAKPIHLADLDGSIQLRSGQIGSTTSSLMGNDIQRQIQLLPGITAHDDNSAAIKIRGSNSDQTLMILDGMPIYNSSHYYGVFSSINANFIDSVHIYKNTYPLQYGGKTAGLVELFGDKNQPDKFEGQFGIDLLTANLGIAIPLSPKSNLKIYSRATLKPVNNDQFNTISNESLLDQMVSSFGEKIDDKKRDPSFTFYDMNVKYQYAFNSDNLLSINLFRSSDQVDGRFDINLVDDKNNGLDLIAKEEKSWSNSAANISYTHKITDHAFWNSSTYFTEYQNEENNSLELKKRKKNGGPPPIGNPAFANLGSSQSNLVRDINLDSHLDYSFNKQIFKLGLTATHHNINYNFSDNELGKINGERSFLEAGGYIGHRIALGKQLNIQSGLRATYFTNLKTTTYSPRILMNYTVTDHVSLKSSFNIENQVIRQFYYEYRGQPMELWVTAGQNDIPILKSTNYMVGGTLKLGFASIDIEAYQKNMNGVLEFLISNPADASNSPNQERVYLQFVGDGLTKGIDFILSSGYKNYDTYLSYTLSRSTEQFKEIFRDNSFSSENDRRHQLKWVNSLRSGNFTWGFNAIYVSGRLYTDIRNINQDENFLEIDPNNRLRRLPAYYRFDISGAYKLNIRGKDAEITASIFNLLDTQNVQYIQSLATSVNAQNNTVNTIIGNESSLLNRTLNLGLKIHF